jgi:predicted DNA-binding transcriptional regulator AlpA
MSNSRLFKPQSNATDLMRYLSEHEVSELTGISIKTLQRWRLAGKGPKFRKLGGRSVRYLVSDIEAWLQAQPSGGAAA